MTRTQVLLVAYDAIGEALGAGSVQFAIERVRPELEVLGREDLLRVAVAISVEAGVRLPTTKQRMWLRRRLEVARLDAMLASS